MGAIASQITSLTIVCSTVYSDADQRKYLSSASLAFVRGNHRGPVNSPHKWPVTRKMFPFDDVIIYVYRIDSDISHVELFSQHYSCCQTIVNFHSTAIILVGTSKTGNGTDINGCHWHQIDAIFSESKNKSNTTLSNRQYNISSHLKWVLGADKSMRMINYNRCM